MIPKIIWQTYKDPYKDLPEYIKKTIQTWINLNPDHEYKYMDDIEARKFIFTEYGKDWVEIWDSCPVGVMRGDIWRYLVIYKYGGIYSDIDTICKKPISEWVDKKYKTIISFDDGGTYYNQLAFASDKNQLAFQYVLSHIKKQFIEPDYSKKSFVDNMTGVKAWTTGIKSYTKNHINDTMFIYPESSIKYLNNGESLYFNGAIHHLTASLNWKDGGYVQWQKEVKENDYTNYRASR